MAHADSASFRSSMAICKACDASLLDKKGNRKALVGDAAGAPAVYTVLFQFLSKECPSYQHSQYHQYLGEEPAFVCKSCFSLMKKFGEMKADLERVKLKVAESFKAGPFFARP